MEKNDFSEILIGVDHGYKNVKTLNSVFPTKLSLLKVLPDDKKGILQINGNVYTENGEDVNYIDSANKISNDNFYILTLIAIAKELKCRGLDGADGARINIAVGLPQRWFEAQKKSFKKYIMKRSEVYFTYEGIKYHIYFKDCKVFTQGYAALLTLEKLEYLDRTVVVCDIGGGTVDIIPVNKGEIDHANSKIDQRGAIWLVNSIQEAAETQLYESIPEDFIINCMINKNAKETPQNKYEKLVQGKLMNYCEMIFNRLKEFRINVDITPIIFVGGGASIIKNFGRYNLATTEFITDIKANVKGYEMIYDLLSK